MATVAYSTVWSQLQTTLPASDPHFPQPSCTIHPRSPPLQSPVVFRSLIHTRGLYLTIHTSVLSQQHSATGFQTTLYTDELSHTSLNFNTWAYSWDVHISVDSLMLLTLWALRCSFSSQRCRAQHVSLPHRHIQCHTTDSHISPVEVSPPAHLLLGNNSHKSKRACSQIA